MGGSQSLLVGNAGLGTKQVLNFLLKEMLKRSDLVDLYSLADPGKCKEYVILSAKEIGRLFTEVNLTPKERGGSLYIQSIEGIKRLSPEEQAVHDANCKKIAFFFIRIFQTFGALTLSVMDDSIPAVDPAAPIVEKGERPRFEKAFARPLPFAPPPKQWRGGALSQLRNPRYFIPVASPYSVLNNYLSEPRGGTPAERMPFTGVSNLQLVQTGLYRFDPATGDRSIADPIRPIVTYSFRGPEGETRASATVGIEADGNRYTLTLTRIRIGDEDLGGKQIERSLTDEYGENKPMLNGKEIPEVISGMFKEVITEKLGFSIVQLLFDKRYIGSISEPTSLGGTRIQVPNPTRDYRANPLPIVYKDSIRVDNKTEAIKIEAGISITKTGDRSYTVGLDFSKVRVSPDYMRQMVDFTGFGAQKVFKANSDSADPLNDKGEKIPFYLQRRFDALLKPAKSGQGRVGTRYTREGLPKPYVLPGVPDMMRVDGLWNALIKTPPVKAHCVARALQLLSVAGIRGDMTAPAFSSVCNTRFQLVVDHSLPGLGQPIVQEYGIAAMASLFVDGLQNNMPLITNGPKYQEFLKRLNMAFYGFKALEGTPQPDAMGDINDQPLTALCVGQGPIQVEAARRNRLRAIALKLINRQKDHYNSVMTLIYRIFDGNKVKVGVFEINPSIMAGGIDAVNRVATDARELLIKYYSDCEETYKQGVIVVQEQERGKTAAVAPAPSAPPTEDENADANANANVDAENP